MSGTFLFGNPLDPSIADAFTLFYNTFTDSRPAEIEIYTSPNVNLDPVGCIASIGCQMIGEGIAYTVREIDWADGTVDRIEFQWAHAPEPTSLLMFLPAIWFLLPGFRRMAAGKAR